MEITLETRKSIAGKLCHKTPYQADESFEDVNATRKKLKIFLWRQRQRAFHSPSMKEPVSATVDGNKYIKLCSRAIHHGQALTVFVPVSTCLFAIL